MQKPRRKAKVSEPIAHIKKKKKEKEAVPFTLILKK